MKFPQSLVSTFFVLLTVSVTMAGPLDQDIQPFLTEGQLAYQRGDLDKAKASFEIVYKMDSRNQTAIGYLRRIKVDMAARPKGNEQEKQLAAVIIPQIQFKDATLGSALDYFKRTVDKVTGGKQSINFVVQLPQEQVNTQTVTLSLSNIPVTEALKYVAELSNATFVYDKYAVIMKPKGAGAPVAETAPATAQ